MITMNDIYYKINSKLDINNFNKMDMESKKEIIDKELKQYIIEKTSKLSNTNYLENQQKEMDTLQAFKILANNIPKEQHFNTIRHFIHYILNIASFMQGWEITWYIEERESLIEYPEVVFNEQGLLDQLITHEKTDYIKSFAFTYDIFRNNFMKEQIVKKIQQK